jgi:hypothetical protein
MRFYGNSGISRERGVFLLKLCCDGGKDEMTACVSQNALEASTGICSARFDSGEIFIEFIIGLKNKTTCSPGLKKPSAVAMMLIIFFRDGLSEDEYAGVTII